jgi:hypothetical protein
MKKIILITLLFAGAVCAKAQPTITIDNSASTSIDVKVQVTVRSLPCGGSFGQPSIPYSATVTAGTVYKGGAVSINDPSWGFIPAVSYYEFYFIGVGAATCGGGNTVGESCSGEPYSSSFVDCSSNTHTITWTPDTNVPPNITVTIN